MAFKSAIVNAKKEYEKKKKEEEELKNKLVYKTADSVVPIAPRNKDADNVTFTSALLGGISNFTGAGSLLDKTISDFKNDPTLMAKAKEQGLDTSQLYTTQENLNMFGSDVKRVVEAGGAGLSSALSNLGKGTLIGARNMGVLSSVVDKAITDLRAGTENDQIEKLKSKAKEKGIDTVTLDEYLNKAKNTKTSLEHINDFSANTFDKWSNEANQRIVELQGETENDFAKKAIGFMPNLSQQAVTIGASLINPVLGTSVATGQAMGSYYNDAKSRGMTDEQANDFSQIMGIVEGATEMISVDKLVKAGKGAKALAKGGLKSARKELSKEVITSTFGNLLGSSMDNFIQEAITEPIQEGVADWIGGKGNWENIDQRMLEAGINGAITSLITGGANIGIQSAVGTASKIRNGQQLTQEQIQQDLVDTLAEIEKFSPEEKQEFIDKYVTPGIKTAQDVVKNELNQVPTEPNRAVPMQTSENAQQQVQEQEQQVISNQNENALNQNVEPQNLVESAEISGIDVKDEKTRKNLEVIQKFNENRGIKATFDADAFKGHDNVNSFFRTDENGNREIVFNPNTMTDKTIQQLAVHEVYHDMVAGGTAQELTDFVIQKMSNNPEYQEYVRALQDVYGEQDSDIIKEEAVAHYLEKNLGTDEFISELQQRGDRTTIQRIIDTIKDMITKAKNTLTGKGDLNYLLDLQRKYEQAYRGEFKGTQEQTKLSKQVNEYQGSHQIDTENSTSLNNLDLNDIESKVKQANGALSKQDISDLNKLKKLKDNDTITIYRASPVNELNNGDWVTTDKAYAQNVAKENGGKVYSYEVNANELLYPNNVKDLPSLHRLSSFQYNSQDNIQENTISNQPTTDNQGRTLTKEQQEYFKDSKARDENGNLKTFYHKTGSNFNTIDFKKNAQGVFWFTDSKQALESGEVSANGVRPGQDANIKEFYVDMKNPASWEEYDKYGIEQLKEKGYDGVLLDDDGITTGFVFNNSNQVKDIDNTNPTKSGDMRFSKSEDAKGNVTDNLDAKNLSPQEIVDNLDKSKGTLLAIHNLSEEKLNGILELGGFPVPSIAVTNNPMSNANFGEISVVFNKDTINPELDSRNKVYGRDAYTSRMPNIASKINKEGLKQVSKLTGIEEWDLRERFKETTLENAVNELRTSEKILDKYLKDKGIEIKPVYRDFKGFSSLNQNTLEKFIKKYPELLDLNVTDQQTYSTYEKYYDAVHNLFIENLIDDISGKGLSTKEAKETAETLYKDYPGYNHWNYFIKDLRQVKELEGNKQLDEYATLKAKQKEVDIDSKEYKDYIANLISPMFEGKYVRNNKDYYTKTGTPRSFEQRYEEFTLDNIVKIMNENKGSGQEGSPFGVGIGELAGDVSKRFKSIEDIKNNENLLDTKNKEEYKALLDKYSDKFRDLQSDISKKYGETSVESIIWRDRGIADAMKNIARKIAEGKKVNVNSVISQYNKNNIDVTEKQAQQTIDLLNDISLLPTDYFEAKPQRAVGLDEVATIVIPEGRTELKKALQDRGLDVIEYNPDIEGDRQAKLNELSEYKFSQQGTGTSQEAINNFLEKTKVNEGTGTAIKDLARVPIQQETQVETKTKEAPVSQVTTQDYLTHHPDYYDGDQFDFNAHRTEVINKANQDIVDIIKNSSNLREDLQRAYDLNEKNDVWDIKTGQDEDNRLTYQQKETILSSLLRSKDIENSDLYKLLMEDTTPRQVAPSEAPTQVPQQDVAKERVVEPIKDITDVERPQIPQGNKVRKTYESIINSNQMTQEAKQIAKELMGYDTYEPQTNKLTLAVADKNIEQNGVNESLTTLTNKVNNNDKISAVDIAMGERLIQYYSKTGDRAKLQEAIQTTAMAGTEAGRAVQAMSMINHQTPIGQVTWIQRSVDKVNKRLAKEGRKAQFNFTPEMQQKILNSTSENLQQNLNEVYQELGKQVPKSNMEKFNEWRYFSMLANPKTHIRNILGNVVMKAVQNMKNKVAGTIEDFVIGDNAERWNSLKGASKGMYEFAKNDLKNADVQSMLGLNENKYNPQSRLQQNQRTFKSDLLENTLGKLFNLNSKALEVEDGWGLKSGYAKAMTNYLNANNLDYNNLTDAQLQKARNYAVQQAKEATFHQDNTVANMLQTLENKNLFSKIALGGAIPFKKTPMNVALTGFEYSPAGFAKTLTTDLVNLRKGKISANQFIDNISKNLTGTAISLLGYGLTQAGILKASGSGDEDKDEFEEATGKQNYSIQIGDKTYSLDWLTPAGIPLFIGSELYQVSHKQEDGNKTKNENEAFKSITKILDATASAMNPMSEMTMISGLTNALKSYAQGSTKSIESMLANVGKSYVTQAVPTALGQIARSTDQYERSTTSTETDPMAKAIDSAKNQIISKIPGLRETLPISTDVWGNERETQSYEENAILPWTSKEISQDPVNKALTDLYDATGESGVLPDNYIDKTLKVDKETYKLTNEEYAELKKQYGKTAHDILSNLTNTNDYKEMTDEQKVKAVKEAYSYAKSTLKVKYSQDNDLDAEESSTYKKVQSVINNGGDAREYFEYVGLIDGLDKDKEKMKALQNSNIKDKGAIYESTVGKKDKTYQIMKATGIDPDAYLDYKQQDFKTDRENDYSAKNQFYDYMDDADMTYEQKLLLTGMNYKLLPGERDTLANYIESLPISAQEKTDMFSKLKGCKINAYGEIYY